MAHIFLSTKRLYIRTWDQRQNKKGKDWEPERLNTIFITEYLRETSLTKLGLVLFLDLDQCLSTFFLLSSL